VICAPTREEKRQQILGALLVPEVLPALQIKGLPP
jgi:hypothetical protein